jgi:hypothetical protein
MNRRPILFGFLFLIRRPILFGLLTLIILYIGATIPTDPNVKFLFGTIGLLLIPAIETYLFSYPARLPRIRRAAQRNPKWRWSMIISLPLLLLFINNAITAPSIININKSQVNNHGSCVDNPLPHELPCDYRFNYFGLEPELHDDFDREILLRHILLSRGHCFSDDAIVCRKANRYFAEISRLSSTLYSNIMLSIPSLITGFLIWRLTRDSRKHREKK